MIHPHYSHSHSHPFPPQNGSPHHSPLSPVLAASWSSPISSASSSQMGSKRRKSSPKQAETRFGYGLDEMAIKQLKNTYKDTFSQFKGCSALDVLSLKRVMKEIFDVQHHRKSQDAANQIIESIIGEASAKKKLKRKARNDASQASWDVHGGGGGKGDPSSPHSPFHCNSITIDDDVEKTMAGTLEKYFAEARTLKQQQTNTKIQFTRDAKDCLTYNAKMLISKLFYRTRKLIYDKKHYQLSTNELKEAWKQLCVDPYSPNGIWSGYEYAYHHAQEGVDRVNQSKKKSRDGIGTRAGFFLNPNFLRKILKRQKEFTQDHSFPKADSDFFIFFAGIVDYVIRSISSSIVERMSSSHTTVERSHIECFFKEPIHATLVQMMF